LVGSILSWSWAKPFLGISMVLEGSQWLQFQGDQSILHGRIFSSIPVVVVVNFWVVYNTSFGQYFLQIIVVLHGI